MPGAASLLHCDPVCPVQLRDGSGSPAEFHVKGAITQKGSHGTVLFVHEVQAKHLAGERSVNLDAWWVRFWQNSAGLWA